MCQPLKRRCARVSLHQAPHRALCSTGTQSSGGRALIFALPPPTRLQVKGKDEAAQQRIEAAHSQLMMAGLSARLKVRLLAGVGLLLLRKPALQHTSLAGT